MKTPSLDIVLVTAKSFGQGCPELRDELENRVKDVRYRLALTREELLEEAGHATGWIAGLDVIDRDVIDRARRLKVIARCGVGTENVDVAAAAAHGIVVANTPGANASAVAELTIGFMFVLARRISFADRAVKQGEWPRLDGIAVRGKRVGLVGLGAIGKEVAIRAVALGCGVVAHDPRFDEEFARTFGVVRVSLPELLHTSDFVSVHVPSNDETRGMVGVSFLAAMRREAYLINTARGDLVDEQALYEALVGGEIAGAALDTLKREPPEELPPVARLDSVVVAPHMGAHNEEAVARMSRVALDECLAVLEGRHPRFAVRPGGFAGWKRRTW